MLDINELLELEEVIRDNLEERLEEILIKLNQKGQLEDLLRLLEMSELLGVEDEDIAKEGKIIVIGQSEVEREKLAAVAKNLGIEKDRFEFYLNYEDAKNFDFKKTQWSDKYSYILVGQMPHSGHSKGDYSSVITALEKGNGYPPVVRMGTKGLKITKSSFRSTLEYLLQEKKIA